MDLSIHAPILRVLVPALALVVSCNRLPEPDFIWGPEDNPEAGAVIWFANKTPEASFYAWHFGDASRSTLENPTHIFAEPGTYQVELTAFNDAGSQVKSRMVTINDPTVLAFTVMDSSATLPLPGTELRIYDNEEAWQEVNNPILVGYANSLGQVEFTNMDPVVYYVWAFRDEAKGYWRSGGYTPALTLNEVNAFLIPCEWFDYESAKAVKSLSRPGGLLRRTDGPDGPHRLPCHPPI